MPPPSAQRSSTVPLLAPRAAWRLRARSERLSERKADHPAIVEAILTRSLRPGANVRRATRGCLAARDSRRIGRGYRSERLTKICDGMPRPDTATTASVYLRVLCFRGRGAKSHGQLLTTRVENRVLSVPLYP